MLLDSGMQIMPHILGRLRVEHSEFAAQCVRALDEAGGLQPAPTARDVLVRAGWGACPGWADLLAGGQPLGLSKEPEPGDSSLPSFRFPRARRFATPPHPKPCSAALTVRPAGGRLAFRHARRPGRGPDSGHGCGAAVDAFGDHYRSVRAEQAWVRVAREAVGPEGRVVPQQC